MKTASILLVVAVSLLVSCDCPIISCCSDVNTFLTLWVHDAEGRSMLDPETPGYFPRDSIKLFTLKDGKLTPQKFLDDLHYRHDVKIDTFRVDFKVHGGLYAHLDNSNFPQTGTTVVEWSANDSDTIDFEVIDKCDSQILLNRTWLNGQLATDRPNRTLDIAK